ncbi:60S ribosomal protein L4 [Tupaia chinensis]|uniref:60S ribosomal protein L4 n=1 Tax=Tupaia chinensis TaxID=246437 RepID=L9KN73_TUPCH|nr:60S ribosomal protein L4 [Tupaia chinensis]
MPSFRPAASALPAPVMSKGHRTEEVPELPLVVEDKVEGYKKIKEAVLLLKKLKAWNDTKKAYASQRMRAGKGKLRNRRRFQRGDPASSVTRTAVSARPSETPLESFCSIVLKRNPLKHLSIVLNLNPYAKTRRRSTVLRQARNHKKQLAKVAAALEARADEKGVAAKKPVVGEKGRGVSAKQQQKPLVGKRAAATKKPAADKKPAAEKKPAEKKLTTEEKKSAA